jgi:hypothetical protein
LLSQQDSKPNSVLCDHLSKRTTFCLQQVQAKHPNGLRTLVYPEPVEGFVLAPGKDLAVSLPALLQVSPALGGGAQPFGLARHCSHLSPIFYKKAGMAGLLSAAAFLPR